MGKISEMKYEIQKKAEQEIVGEVINRMKIAIELKEQGKDVEGDKVVNDMKNWLEEVIQKTEKVLEQKEKSLGQKEMLVIERSDLPQNGEVVAVGDKVILGVLQEDEKEKYLAVNAEYSYIKGAYNDEEFCKSVWNDFISDTTFVCSIYDKVSKEYVGYCAVKSLVKNEWELAIELEPDECHKGYGTEALSLLIQSLHRLTGKRYFRTRVEIDNHASQGLMKKLGAIPDGIGEFLLHGDEIEKFKEEHRDMITDEIRAVAEEFCMDAEDILGYVLEYRFDVENMQ